ncbi:DUF1129 family protein [Rossellomorea marisflavi]|uniref:DUF1129 family protein n=1 Tax=Rossellomorea marisflavi TaxID=189381 RepID=UPI00345838C1
MIAAKELIELNNRKREELTEENEKYYSDILLYLRLQLTLSEQQTEEILMEILEHLLEGQGEGKTATMIFGSDPKAYADELVEQLPPEDKRSVAGFIALMALNLFGIFLAIRGAGLLITSFFKEVENDVFIGSAAILAVILLLTTMAETKMFFSIIKRSLFQEKDSAGKMALIGGLGAAAISLPFFLALFFLPDFGPSFPFSWWASLIAGLIMIGLYKLMSRKRF